MSDRWSSDENGDEMDIKLNARNNDIAMIVVQVPRERKCPITRNRCLEANCPGHCLPPLCATCSTCVPNRWKKQETTMTQHAVQTEQPDAHSCPWICICVYMYTFPLFIGGAILKETSKTKCYIFWNKMRTRFGNSLHMGIHRVNQRPVSGWRENWKRKFIKAESNR